MDESRPLSDGFLSHSIRKKPVSTGSESIELPNKSHQPRSSIHIIHSEPSPAYVPIDKQDRLPRKTSWIHRLWLWEVSSIAVAVLALAAVIITLLLHRDRPIPKWPSAITINTLIAIFTAILKACLMMPIAEAISQLKWLWFQTSRPLKHMEQFDIASRGPWGSLILIFTLKGRDLAVVGAVLTLVAMAIDPFAQQIIQYYSCSVIVSAYPATVPFSNNYTDGIYGRPGDPQVDAQLQSAIYIGLLDPPSNSSVRLSYNCRTGNCTFPSTGDGAAFLSLAFESSCIDISDDIQYSLNFTNRTSPIDNSTYTLTIASTSLPNGVSYDNMSVPVMQSGNEYSRDLPSNFLSKVSFLMGPPYPVEGEKSARAFECELFPAVNTYSANITNGILTEHVLNSQRMDVWPLLPAFSKSYSFLLLNRTIRSGSWEECKGVPDPSDENTYPVITPLSTGDAYIPFGEFTNVSSREAWNRTRWFPRDCVYYLAEAPTTGLFASIESFLGNESLYFSDWTHRANGDLWAIHLWNNGSATLDTVQKFMNGLTSSVTTRWRQGDGISVNMGPANGSVYENTTCMRVNWGWVALPAALVLLTIIFLLLTIIQAGLEGSGLVWKSSTWALLFNGLDAKTRQSYGPVSNLEDVKEAAGTATVQLQETGDGWRLVRT